MHVLHYRSEFLAREWFVELFCVVSHLHLSVLIHIGVFVLLKFDLLALLVKYKEDLVKSICYSSW